MTPIEDLTQATALLSRAARVDRAALSDADLVARLRAEEEAGRFLDAARALSAAEVAERSRYELGADGLSMRFGERKTINFIEQVTRVSQREATRRVRLGSQIRSGVSMLGEALPPDRPIVAEAMINGLIGVDTAQVITCALKQAERGSLATPDNLDIAELELVRQATSDSADLIADAARVWRDALDPDGLEPRYDEIMKQRLFSVGREHNGIRDYILHAAPVLAAAIDALLEDSMDAGAAPRFLSEEDRAAARVELVETSGGVVERLVEPRSLGQKQYDIFEAVILAGLAQTRTGSPDFRTFGSVIAIIDKAELESGTGFGILEGIDEPVPARVIREIAATAPVHTVVLADADADAAPGYSMASEQVARRTNRRKADSRYFPDADRRAMIARDGDRCIAKGCRRKASRSHAHHVVFFSNGGRTVIGNGVLLCPAHHHALHQGAFEIRMIRGRPYIRDGIDAFNEDAWWAASRSRLRKRRFD